MCVLDSILRGMQLVRSASLKASHSFSSIWRNASFSSGWLHLAVQVFFAVIIVTSFILIIIMSIPKFPPHPQAPPRVSRCNFYSNSCMVYCEEVPYFRKYRDDIVKAVSKLPDTCTGFRLTLHKPMFMNNTFPRHWPRMRIPIYELSIVDGNLMHFPPQVFLSNNFVSIRTLVLYGLMIETLTASSFVGLSSLSQLHIKNSNLINVETHVLQSVHDTLESLTITACQEWDPTKLSGTPKLLHLINVDFSNNIFNDVLDKDSFIGLESCKILYLNSCKIFAIGLGAFDHLHSIEILYLNDNLLVTIPAGLFNNLILYESRKPRIHLKDNLWHCHCLNSDIKQLVLRDMLLVDPICISPESFKDKTFTELQNICDELKTSTSREIIPTEDPNGELSGFIYINDGCYNGDKNSVNSSMMVLSPMQDHSCWTNKIYRENITTYFTKSNSQIVSKNSWIKFTFFIRSKSFSMMQLGAVKTENYGLLWHQTSCPNEVYCVDSVPTALRVYNIDVNAHYIFCPVRLSSGAVETERCVFYNLSTMENISDENEFQIFLYLCTGGICLILGAICVYALVRKNPNLLRGSKRILFVKHKTLDALVLPPKVPLRNDLIHENGSEVSESHIFTLPSNAFDTGRFNRNKSTRSSKSNAPSYISALQPTEDQLAEWRIKNHFNNELTICSADFFPYTELVDNDITYESLK